MICKICLNDNSVRNISFNSDGICCFCEKYEKIKDKLNDQSTLSSLFEQRVEKVRGNYDYDAAVGISGGKDSVYVLYRLAKDYGLHIRAFTMDNGFLSTKARENIDRVVSQLGVEHEYIEFDMKKLQRFYHYSMKKWLVPCIACSYIGYASMVNYASRINAGMVVHGRSPAQMIRFYDKDIYSELIKPGLLPPEDTDISGLYSSLLKNIEKKMDRDIMLDVREMLMKDTNEKDLREITEAEVDSVVPKLEHLLTPLGTISNIATLLGLLGTVTGNIKAFGVLGNGGTMGDPSLLASSIAEALVTTVAGLCVAIPSVIFHNYFVSRVNHRIVEMESAVTTLLLKITGRVR